MAKKRARQSADADSTAVHTWVIINGLSGAMGGEILKACKLREIQVASFALSRTNSTLEKSGTTFRLVTAEPFADEVMQLRADSAQLVVIDFTNPSIANANAELYNKLNLPFVMGTTGGDEVAMVRGVKTSKNTAVIAPNMGKQVVAFQAMFEYMATKFPGSFRGHEVSVTESHQTSKADTSGTAKAVCESLSILVGKRIGEESIAMLRTVEDNVKFGVDEAYLSGHAYHTYKLTSEDKSAVFEFKHNVNGRAIYAEGVVDAVLFLLAQRRAKGKVFDMVDVLKASS